MLTFARMSADLTLFLILAFVFLFGAAVGAAYTTLREMAWLKSRRKGYVEDRW